MCRGVEQANGGGLRQSRRYPREEGSAVVIPARGVAEEYAASDTLIRPS